MIQTYDETEIQVHYFTRGNPQPNKKKAIRRLLRASGFTILNTSEFYENDTNLHISLSKAWIEGVITIKESENMAKIGLKYPIQGSNNSGLLQSYTGDIAITVMMLNLYADDAIAESDKSFQRTELLH